MSLASSLNVGVSALRSYAQGLQVVSNNIANVNTVGYKASHAQYSDTFSNILKPLVPNENNTAVKVAPTQVGGGVQIQSIAPVFSQGTIQTTSSNSDLAIAGNGFFRVKNSQTGESFVTRSGNFRVDADGYMVTQQGYRVQGSIGAKTKVVYDSVNGSYDVKGQQDNVKITIPSGLVKQEISVSVTAGSAVIGRDIKGALDGTLASTELAFLKVGMPVSGDGLPPGTQIKSIDNGVVTLNNKAFAGSSTTALANAVGADKASTFTSNNQNLVVGSAISGTGIAPGTIITDKKGTSTVGVSEYTLSKPLTAALPSVPDAAVVAPSKLQISLLNVDAESNSLTFPPDHNRPALAPGQILLGPGIESGTTIQSVLGNNKFVIPASASSKTLLGVNTVNTAPVALTAAIGTTGSSTFTSTDTNLKVGMMISGTGFPDGTLITGKTGADTYTVSKSLTADLPSTPNAKWSNPTSQITLSDVVGLAVGMVISLPQAFGPGEKVRIKEIIGSVNPPVLTLDKTPITALSDATAVASGEKTLEAGISSIFLPDITGIEAGQPISGDGIPAGTFVGAVGLGVSDGFGNFTVPLVDAKGVPRFLSNSSYGAVSLAFGNQTVSLSKRPISDTFDTTNLSVSTEYAPASKIGDLKVSFTEGSDFAYYGTDGVKLSGIPLEAARASGPRIRTFNVGTNGQVNIVLSNGQTFSGGSVLLQSFKDPGALIREGDNLFSGIYTAGPYNGNWDETNIRGLTAGLGGLGSINGGALELSNVDIGEEFSTMIVTQRAFQAGSRVISTADQMLEEAVNLKR